MFAADLLRSEIVPEPPDDVMAAFACYDVTLRSLLDKFTPLQKTTSGVCGTAATWFHSYLEDR
jgi:hypothetical protein